MRHSLRALAMVLAISVLFGSASIAETLVRGITLEDAKKLPDRELAERLMSSLAVVVVDVDRTQFLQDPATEIRLALRPKPVENGVCASTILHLNFSEEAIQASAKALTGLETATFYKIRGNPDQNVEQDEKAFQAICAADHPFKDNYFVAPDDRDAQAAGKIIDLMHAEIRKVKRTVRLSCHGIACRNIDKIIANASVNQIEMVEAINDCRNDRLCLRISFADNANCWEIWSVVAQYKAPFRKQWGVATPLSIRLEPKACPSPES